MDSFVPLRLFDPIADRPSSWLELCRQFVRCPTCSNQFQELLAKEAATDLYYGSHSHDFDKTYKLSTGLKMDYIIL